MDTIHDALLITGTQQKLADICGVSQASVSNWSRGVETPSARTITLIYRKLGIDLRHLRPEVFDVESAASPRDDLKALKAILKKEVRP
jgi:transcriptional regulator with XRE-family HTH domain